ncbi:M1 family metallopeptidase [Pendulispora albinea]|uniref:Aminopeptidase n=1 Tax=Pendulispora albinea TaxID=2741071 RepID=A0ABZ2M8W2_9BACT
MRQIGCTSLFAIFLALAGCQAHDATEPAKAAPVAPAASGPAPVASAPGAAAPKPPALRLPESIKPTAYDATLTVVPTEERFDGHITIGVELMAPSDVVWLNASGIEVRTATVNGAPAKVIPGGEDFVGIQVAQPLAAGKATLVLDYSGELSRKNSHGLFKQKEGDQWYVFTHFESMDARRAFPCFDEPGFKTPWKIRLKVKRDQQAFANTPSVSEKIEGDYKIVQFAETKPLPSYLVALGVGPFDVVDAGTAGKNRTPIRIIVPHGRAAEARFAKEVSPQVLNELEAYFGIPYPYEKLDCIDVPMGGGAMENPGLITFHQRLILSRPERETTRFRHAYTSVATHEFAHQWFGDLVTTAWWDDIWLNEAFATWMTSRTLERWKPEWNEGASRVLHTDRAMRNDSLVSARRIRQPILGKDDVKNAFDDITYRKGAAVIRMFETWASPEVFRAGVQRYLAKYAHGTATADQFLSAVFEGNQAPLIGAFGSFLNQPGVPLVTASLRCDAGQPPKLALSQARYLPLGSEGSTDARWQIPVCARYPGKKGDALACTLLTEAKSEVALPEAASCPAWVEANADARGYYRVHYEGDLLRKLLDSGSKSFSAAEKTALLSDLSALVQNGKVSYADALAVVPKLANDPSGAVVAATIELVSGLRDTEMFPAALRPKYARFIRDTYGPRARKLGFVPRAGESDDTRLLRQSLVSLVADQGEDRALAAEAKKLAQRWLGERKGVDADMVDAVLGIATRTGDRALFDQTLAAARKAQDRHERTQILYALGQFRDPEIVRASLPLLLSEEFDPRESSTLRWGALAAPATRQLAYDFVKQNFDALAARIPRDDIARLAQSGSAFCDEAHRADLESFFRDRAPRYLGGPRILAQTTEAIKLCAAYRTRQAPNVQSFLQKL